MERVEESPRRRRPRVPWQDPRQTALWGLLDTLYERVKASSEERFERRYGLRRGLADEVVAGHLDCSGWNAHPTRAQWSSPPGTGRGPRVGSRPCRAALKSPRLSRSLVGSPRKLLGGWRRRPESNRGIEVLQTSALTTWLRRPQPSMVREPPPSIKESPGT